MKLKNACIKAAARRKGTSVAFNSCESQTHEAVIPPHRFNMLAICLPCATDVGHTLLD